MTYIKFVAKPETWFKPGTEVLWEDSSFTVRRPTIEEYNNIIKPDGAMTGVGIRVCENNSNENNLGYNSGNERVDGEWCNLSEFIIEEINEDNYQGKR